jgi:hypothetical protein
LGAFGVLLVVMYFILRAVVRGDLVPRATVDALLAARDAEIARANERGEEWHTAYEAERHVSDAQRDHVRELTEVARTVEKVVEAVQLVAEGRVPSD